MNPLNERMRVLTIQLQMELKKECPNQHNIEILEEEFDKCWRLMNDGN